MICDCQNSTITHFVINMHPRNMLLLVFNTEVIKDYVSFNSHYILSSQLALT